MTTHEFKNHAIRTEKWRYIQYHDGSEELYDEVNDPMEWKNLANDPKFTSFKVELAKWLPLTNVPTPASKNASKDKNVMPHWFPYCLPFS